MNKLLILFLGWLIAVTAVVHAQTDKTRSAIGTISTVAGEHVTLKTTDGKTLTVMLDQQTVITRGNEKLDRGALKAGVRIAVDYVEAENKMLMARVIKVATGEKR